MIYLFFQQFCTPLKMAKVSVNVELSGLLAVGGISVAILMWDHHSNHGRVLATLEKLFSALGKFLCGEANEKSAKADEGTSKTKSPPKKKTPDADDRKITDGILQGKSGIPAATSDVQNSEEDTLETVEISFEDDQQSDEERFIGEYPFKEQFFETLTIDKRKRLTKMWFLNDSDN